MQHEEQEPAKTRKSKLPGLIKKAHQHLKQAEQVLQREDGQWDGKLVKLRSILCMMFPGLERQMRGSKKIEEPGVRDFLLEMKFRVQEDK